MTRALARRYACAMATALQKLAKGQQRTVTSLRTLADRLEALAPKDAYEAHCWIAPHVAKLLAEGAFILQASKTGT